VALANWFPGNFHHWLHDTVPILLFLNRFRVPSVARFALIDHPLHRRLLNWLDPELARRVDWIPLGKVTCLHDATSTATSTSTLSSKEKSSNERTSKEEGGSSSRVTIPPAAATAAATAAMDLEKELAVQAALGARAGYYPPLAPLFKVESKLTKLTKVATTTTIAVDDDETEQQLLLQQQQQQQQEQQQTQQQQQQQQTQETHQQQRYRPSLVAVQYRSAVSVRAAKNKAARANKPFHLSELDNSWPPLIDGATIFNLRNSALSRLMALEIARLKPRRPPPPSLLPPHSDALDLTDTSITSIATTTPLPATTSTPQTQTQTQTQAQSPLLRVRRVRRRVPKIVFYRRWSATTLHGRTMSLEHEEHLFQVVRKVMKQFGRTEQLVVFTGEDPTTGRPLSFQVGRYRYCRR
jgi:hypothetical protein